MPTSTNPEGDSTVDDVGQALGTADDDALADALVPEERLAATDFDTLAARAETYGAKLFNDPEVAPKRPSETTSTPSYAQPTASRAREKQSVKRTGRGKQAGGGNVSRAAATALRNMKTAATVPDIKPLPSRPSTPTPQSSTMAQTAASPEGTVIPAPEPETKTDQDERPSHDGPRESAPEIPATTTRGQEPLGDEGFPSVQVPTPSNEYAELSAISSQYENMSGDMETVTRQLVDIKEMMASQNMRMAHLERALDGVKEDKAQFQASLLDRIRKIERDMGNRPPLATSASAVAPLVMDDPSPSSSSAGPPVDRTALLARIRAKRQV